MTFCLFLLYQTQKNVEQFFQSFTIMARDYDEWLQTNPKKISFPSFAYDMNYELNDRNRTLYGFLFLREDEDLMKQWQEDDERDRVISNNFLKVSYPGTTKEDKEKWRKEHLRQLLNLPNEKRIESRATANRLIKLLSEGKITSYAEPEKYTTVTVHEGELPMFVTGVCLKHFQDTFSNDYELDYISVKYTMKRKRA